MTPSSYEINLVHPAAKVEIPRLPPLLNQISIEWPSQQVGQEAVRDLYDGMRLPSPLVLVGQFILAVLACRAEMKRHWDKPFFTDCPLNALRDLRWKWC